MMKRRQFLHCTMAATLGLAAGRLHSAPGPVKISGAVIGEPTASLAGQRVLDEGGNAVDAVIAAALVAAVVSPHNCGIGGYGGHLMVSHARSRKIGCVDFNTMAPAAARPDMFPLNAQGQVPDLLNDTGWLAAGVPGTLAGLELGLKRFGTRSFRDTLQPALAFARDGFPVSAALAGAIKSTAALLQRDAGSTKLYFNHGQPLKAGETHRNPALAELLARLAEKNSTEDFYRGASARQIAAAFQKGGGLVTAKDLAAYEAREVKPLKLDWLGHSLYTAPLTAGGFTVLQAFGLLKGLRWETRQDSPDRFQFRLEALRAAWHDRLKFLGDPQQAKVPMSRLMSEPHTRYWAAQIEAAVKARQPLKTEATSREQGGTIHLSAGDRHGNLAAVTLTHGNSFGARVTVEELGLTLGHGMSRFEPQPGHPNSVAPRKRPLDNMCPTIVTRQGEAVLALGGAGGRRIPNAAFDVLLDYLTAGQSLDHAIAAPRVHTEGDLKVRLEKDWPVAVRENLQQLGYEVETAGSARISAVAHDPRSGECRAASR